MADFGQSGQDVNREQVSPLLLIFPGLTPKQHEVLCFVAENRTSKEIAWELGISESAVNQRIEGVRTRAGALPRAELARAYRLYLQELEAACNPIPDKNTQVPGRTADVVAAGRDENAEQFALADAMTYTVTAPWQSSSFDRVVPEVLDGANAGLIRTAAMVAIAGGMLLVAMVGLGVVRALSDLI
ncbi:helix-turn-helix transcriptional regulator [Novosphingobium sp. P6W]|jgi:DNA-binding CsgD family transcriptional regulator|uniref:helix-turn-helix transcriptional regulator n=1 Tax=Novosphingobium sp. P6W TaxID=1609758 RepID=UPI0005C2BE57|nr:helix-turn-helix transcriptional regulator [Novosphingobium sp. P6W]AXB77024.1 LuxR family transcriptional regulator [Novosphingobium sp. P6W]KIS33136.1 LuxR family transcriptional regulator [Novosphingobium sp. P6W]